MAVVSGCDFNEGEALYEESVGSLLIVRAQTPQQGKGRSLYKFFLALTPLVHLGPGNRCPDKQVKA